MKKRNKKSFSRLLCAALAVCLLLSLGGCKKTESKGSLDNEGFGTTDITARSSYAVETAAPGDENMKLVIARCGDTELTNEQFAVYYWMEFYNFINFASNYGVSPDAFGLSTDKPLDQQESIAPIDENDENSDAMTWEQYFIEAALTSYQKSRGLAQAAAAAGFTLEEDQQKTIDELETTMEEDAKQAGYDSADAYVQASFGDGVTLADYQSYLRTYYTAYAYSESLKDVDLTEQELADYFDKNLELIHEKYQKGIERLNDVTIRHILIEPEVADGEEEATDEAWAAAETEANRIYEQWKENPTEDNFSELAKQYSADGNADEGGIYEDVYPGQMVETFNDWCFDSSRKTGDSGIVKTKFGYHIMYFVETTDSKTWQDVAKNAYGSELADAEIAKYPTEVNYRNIRVFDLVSASAVKEAEK